MTPLFDIPPTPVLAHFAPHTDGLTWHRAPSGFSGARVWRGADARGAAQVALKAWPADTTPERLQQIHDWIARGTHLSFVPELLRGANGSTVCSTVTGPWDCCRWMPGAPRTNPTPTEAATACAAVARLHDAWAGESRHGPCPGVLNRIRVLAENESVLRAGPGALPPVSPLLDPLLRRGVELVARAAPFAVRAIEPWARHPRALQPCVRDLRAEHVLFDGGAVSGVIDCGAAAVDHPAVDLARLLGDYDPVEGASFAAGLAAYRAARPVFDAPDELVRLLARLGAVCSALGWVVRLAVHREPVSDPAAIVTRLDLLLARLAHVPHF